VRPTLRHADASKSGSSTSATAPVALEVLDDGQGIPLAGFAKGPRPARHVRHRAALIGVTLEVAPRVEGGTQ
jgi:signal transduction histidine kinase